MTITKKSYENGGSEAPASDSGDWLLPLLGGRGRIRAALHRAGVDPREWDRFVAEHGGEVVARWWRGVQDSPVCEEQE